MDDREAERLGAALERGRQQQRLRDFKRVFLGCLVAVCVLVGLLVLVLVVEPLTRP